MLCMEPVAPNGKPLRFLTYADKEIVLRLLITNTHS
jgi:hypothetical protein